MDLGMALAVLFFSLLLLASAVISLLLLRHCLALRRTTTADPEASPHQPQELTATAAKKPAQEAAEGSPRRLTWREVEALTGGFDEATAVGRGGSSTVYLARHPDGSEAAVKVHRCGGGERRLREFRQELGLLQRLRHPHIVRLLAYSDDSDEGGALVLEYLPGGTLADRLHTAATPSLPWPQRMRIIHEVAGALEHLHDASGGPVVHGDVSASNVLLDSHSDARLCDFGSACEGFSATVSATRTAVGSPGYADPFFLRTGIVTKKSDVYSFGVLVLEVITGLPAVGSGSDDKKNLTAQILPRLKSGSVEGLVDPRLGGAYDVAKADDLARIAIECVTLQPGLRPTMAQVRATISDKKLGISSFT